VRFIQWGIRNPVTVNLLMIIIIFLGIASAFVIKREMFPAFDMDLVRVSVVMEDGSTPDLVDDNIVQLILPAIQSVDGVREIYSSSTEYAANIIIEVESGYDANIVKQDIEDEIDSITTFPEKALDPRIVVMSMLHEAIHLAVHSETASDTELRDAAEDIKKELQNKKIASRVEVFAPNLFEIAIHLPIETLQAKGLTIKDVADQIKRHTIEMNAGTIRTTDKDIIIKGSARKTSLEAIKDIPITFSNGEFLTLEQLAGGVNISDGFVEEKTIVEYNGKRAVLLIVKNTINDDVISLCGDIHDFASKVSLPKDIQVSPIHDISVFIRDRLSLIIKNGLIGLVLVITVLSLFLEWKTAFWSALGIGFSLIGTLGFLYLGGQSVNMISLFAFLMTMGVIVDDAIVIAESFFHKRQEGLSAYDAALAALKEVSWPVIAMMSTTIVAFIPLLFVDGVMGKFIYVMPVVVIIALILSLFEALFILPSHLAHHSGETDSIFITVIGFLLYPLIYVTGAIRPIINDVLNIFVHAILRGTLRFCLYHRYAVSVFFLGFLVLLFGTMPMGILKTEVFPSADADFHVAELVFDRGTPIDIMQESTHKVSKALQEASHALTKKNNKIPPLNEFFTDIGGGQRNKALIVAELVAADNGRIISGQEFLDTWRKRVPLLPEVSSITFDSARAGPPAKPLEVDLYSDDHEALERAKSAAIKFIATMPGLVDIHSSDILGAHTFNVAMKPEYNNLGIKESDVIMALMHVYQGIKVDTFYRNENEIKIYVRAAKEDREALYQLKNIHMKNGLTIGQVADIEPTRSPGEIKRRNTNRTITVYANIDRSTHTNAVEIRERIEKEFLTTTLKEEEPNVSWSYSGEAKEGVKAFLSIFKGYIPALFVIYLILATIFRSYLQPMIIMIAIPFSFIGAILGHLIMGIPFSIMSGFGIVALTGIAVNDSLVLIDCINKYVKEKKSLSRALTDAVNRRIRPILLTSLTTMAGMAPVMLERSFQAQFLIPMVVSIVFGVAFSSMLILILIPVGYYIVQDVLGVFEKKRTKVLEYMNDE
jgi:hydrophobic/amphiphilic exporter-1 (mainly G- bacteria), HAE1 family